MREATEFFEEGDDDGFCNWIVVVLIAACLLLFLHLTQRTPSQSTDSEQIVNRELEEAVQSSDFEVDDQNLNSGRSGRWRSVRAAHVRLEPKCIVCDSDENLNVHHIIPFNDNPDLELDPDNLCTLCREHHFSVGHDPDFRGPETPGWSKSNKNVVADSLSWRRELGLPKHWREGGR